MKKICIKKSEKHMQMVMHRKLELSILLLITCEFNKLVGGFHFSINLNICYFLQLILHMITHSDNEKISNNILNH